MNRFRRYSYLVFGVAVLLALAGVSLYVLLPPRMEERARDMAGERARATAQYVAAYVTKGLAEQDSAQVRDAVQLVRLDRDLAYAVVVAAEGGVLASTMPNVKVGALWSGVAFHEDRREVLATVPVVSKGWLQATVYVGMGWDRYSRGAERDRKLILAFSLFLVLLGGGVGVGVWQLKALREAVEEWQKRHRSLRMHTGSLQSSVKEHRQTEQALKKSEEKYRSLFESTMEQAMRDLEVLNSDLEQQKIDLEHEVVVRKRAEAALRRYAERLTVMNAVERTMLEGGSFSDSVEHALRRLRELISAAHVSLIDINARSGTGRVEGIAAERGMGEQACERMARMDFAGFAKGAGSTHYVTAISDREDPSSLERTMIGDGIDSYAHIPLVVEEEVVGVLNVASERKNAFSEEDLGIARDVADLLAIGIRQTRMESERVRYEAELIAAKERAEDMARLKSAFLTNMSHEIRTPISGIMGFSQVLHEEVAQPLQEFTGLIRGAAHRLLNTINSVLELARLESSGGRVQTTVVNVGEVIKDTCDELRPLAAQKGLVFNVRSSAETIWSELDLASVERIITNLVDNAVKFTESGEIEVSVSADSKEVTIQVADTGVGIGAEFLPKLFEEFRQEQMDANREHEGSGLGLAITKKLVDLLGGEIRVKSKKGAGTTVEVRFKRLTVTEREKQEPRGHVVILAASSSASERLSQEITSDFRVSTVDSLKEAAAVVSKRGALAVVVDVNVGGGIDSQVVQTMRSGRPTLKLLAIASQVLPDNVEDVLSAGFDRFIVTPFDGESLISALQEDERTRDRTPVQGSVSARLAARSNVWAN